MLVVELTLNMSLNKGQSHPKPTGSQHVQKDITMLDGEACNVDGSLKDAAEMIWLHSPGSKSSLIPFSKRTHNNSDEDEITLKKKNLCKH